jgi:hypothetical protein
VGPLTACESSSLQASERPVLRHDAVRHGRGSDQSDRLTGASSRLKDIPARNRRSIAVDLKKPEGVEVVLRLCESAAGLFEGPPRRYRTTGPRSDDCMARNAKPVTAA